MKLENLMGFRNPAQLLPVGVKYIMAVRIRDQHLVYFQNCTTNREGNFHEYLNTL